MSPAVLIPSICVTVAPGTSRVVSVSVGGAVVESDWAWTSLTWVNATQTARSTARVHLRGKVMTHLRCRPGGRERNLILSIMFHARNLGQHAIVCIYSASNLAATAS